MEPRFEIRKGRQFNPAPVAGKIPYYANSLANPKCKGTKAWEDWWFDQFETCKTGIDTGGLHITGRYYYYLNFVTIQGLFGPQHPWYCDVDLEFWNCLEYVKKNKKPGMIVPKARRKGVSEKAKAILSYGLRFIEGYKGAIAAGADTWKEVLRLMFTGGEFVMPDEMRLSVLQSNDKIHKIGYNVKDELGVFIEEGYGGILRFETMFDKAEKLEGEYFHDVICEESGQFTKLSESIESIKPALEFGSVMIGTFYVVGTGGNILTTSRAFKEIWDNAETLGFEKFWVPGTRLYYPFFCNPHSEYFNDPDSGEKIDGIPNLREKYKPYERKGMEDLKAAERYILKKREEYAKLPNKKKLIKHNQNYPLTPEEAFTSSGSNNFNTEKIYGQIHNITTYDIDEYKPYWLDYVKEKNEIGLIRKVTPLQVKAFPFNPKIHPEGEKVMIKHMPLPGIKDLDVSGVDSYNEDQSQTTKSLGANFILRRGNLWDGSSIIGTKGLEVSAYYYQRPKRKEIFYEVCLKMSIFWNLLRNTMHSAEYDLIIDYYIKNGGRKYLSPRPKAFDAPRSKMIHKYGAKFTGYSKPLVIPMVQTFIEDHIQFCTVLPLLYDMLAYDEENIGTDWDSVDALAYALMRIIDMKTRPRENIGDEHDDRYDLVEWVKGSDGLMIPKVKSGISKDPQKLEGPGGWIVT